MTAIIRRYSLIAALFDAIPALAQPPAPDEAAAARMKKDLVFLAGPECEGRGVGTIGLDKAADYIATAFKAAGLKPGAKDGTYFQPFSINNYPELDGPNRLAFAGPDGKALAVESSVDFKPLV